MSVFCFWIWILALLSSSSWSFFATWRSFWTRRLLWTLDAKWLSTVDTQTHNRSVIIWRRQTLEFIHRSTLFLGAEVVFFLGGGDGGHRHRGHKQAALFVTEKWTFTAEASFQGFVMARRGPEQMINPACWRTPSALNAWDASFTQSLSSASPANRSVPSFNVKRTKLHLAIYPEKSLRFDFLSESQLLQLGQQSKTLTLFWWYDADKLFKFITTHNKILEDNWSFIHYHVFEQEHQLIFHCSNNLTGRWSTWHIFIY